MELAQTSVYYKAMMLASALSRVAPWPCSQRRQALNARVRHGLLFQTLAAEREALRKTIDREQRKRLKLKPPIPPGTHRGTHAARKSGTAGTPDPRNHAVAA
jgi:hypothetical protein